MSIKDTIEIIRLWSVADAGDRLLDAVLVYCRTTEGSKEEKEAFDSVLNAANFYARKRSHLKLRKIGKTRVKELWNEFLNS